MGIDWSITEGGSLEKLSEEFEELKADCEETRKMLMEMEQAIIDLSRVADVARESYDATVAYFDKNLTRDQVLIYKGWWMGFPALLKSHLEKHRELINRILDQRVIDGEIFDLKKAAEEEELNEQKNESRQTS